MLETARDPLIIIGMHRSGTTLMVQCLERLGFFAGRYQDTNAEALFFQKLNFWLLSQCHGGWERPEVIHPLLQNARIRELVVRKLELSVQSLRAVEYLGFDRLLRDRNVTRLEVPWGWKDPLNTFTLPLWLDLFPRARVLHVRRHGVDVAQSLKYRHDWLFERAAERFEKQRWLYQLKLKRRGFANVRVASLDAGLQLWEEYVAESERHVAKLGAQALEVVYEDLLQSPHATLERVAGFAGWDVDEAGLKRASEGISADRAYAYRRKEDLRAFAVANNDRLERFGYSEK